MNKETTSIKLLPNYNRVAMEQLVKLYPGKTLEQYLSEKMRVFGHNELTQILLSFKDSDLMSSESLDIINKLFADSKITEKLLYIYDGSGFNNRLWFRFDIVSKRIVIDPELGYDVDEIISRQQKKLFTNLSKVEKIDWLYDHFDYINLQLPANFKPNQKSIYNMIYEDISNYNTFYSADFDGDF